MTWETFQEIIPILIPYAQGLSFSFDESKIGYTISEKAHFYTREEFDALSSALSLYTNGSTYLYNSHSFEMLISPSDTRIMFRYQEDCLDIFDDTISYKLSMPSQEMVLGFLTSIPIAELRRFRRPYPVRYSYQRENDSETDEITLFDLILRSLRIHTSLKIVSPNKELTAETYKRHANSFLFNLSYNTGFVCKPVPDINDLAFDHRGLVPMRRLKAKEMDVPHLFYNSELTEQYNLALSSSDPFIQFIAYYHIMEHFFDDVYNGTLIKSIREILTNPSFSAKKPKEISKIINIVQKKTKASKEGFQGSELEALELTIKAYMTMEELHQSLYDYNPDLINYYKTHTITFSDGDTLNFEDYSNEKLPKKVAARIYKTRNSLVHSKSNSARIKDRGIYHPFTDEKELAKEIPLMRLIAEAIIIRSAEEI